MLIPRFTIRSLLVLTAGCGVFSLVVAAGVRGQLWASSVAIAVASVGVAFLAYALVFSVASALAAAMGLAGRRRRRGTPFATAEPPPQIIAPEEPE